MNEFFRYGIDLAKRALITGDVPIGAVVVYQNKVIGEGFNTREKDQNILGHAEINAIIDASKKNNNWNLSDCDLYVTLEPCAMCREIIKQVRMKNVYFLVRKPSEKKEFDKTIFQHVNVDGELNDYLNILSKFFQELREKNK